MPKAAKVKSKKITVICKDLDIEADVEIFSSDTSEAIYRRIRAALTSNWSAVSIVGEDDRPLQLHYGALKTTSKIFAVKSDMRLQGVETESSASRSVIEYLPKIREAWVLGEDVAILPPHLAPRARNIAGQPATALDVARVLRETEWTAVFAVAVYKLSRKSLGLHSEAVALLEQIVAERQADSNDLERFVVGLLSSDVEKAVERRLSRFGILAEEGMERVSGQEMIGGLREGIMRVEEEMLEEKERKEGPIMPGAPQYFPTFSLPVLPGRSLAEKKKGE